MSWIPVKNKNLKTQIESLPIIFYGMVRLILDILIKNQVYNYDVKNDYFFEKYYLSGCFKIIWNNIGVYLQTNLTNYSTLFQLSIIIPMD